MGITCNECGFDPRFAVVKASPGHLQHAVAAVGRVGVSSDVLPFSHVLVFPMNRHRRTSRLELHGPAQKMSHRVRVRLWLPLQGVQASLSAVNTRDSFPLICVLLPPVSN